MIIDVNKTKNEILNGTNGNNGKRLLIEIKDALEMNTIELADSINYLKQCIKHRKYHTPMQKEKDVIKLNKLLARDEKVKLTFEMLSNKSYKIYTECKQFDDKATKTIDTILSEVISWEQDILSFSNDKATGILKLIKRELEKHSLTKQKFTRQFVYDVNSLSFYSKYNFKTTKFIKFLKHNKLNLPKDSTDEKAKEDRVFANKNQYIGVYLSDIRHYIQLSDDFQGKANIVLNEIIETYKTFMAIDIFIYREQMDNLKNIK